MLRCLIVLSALFVGLSCSQAGNAPRGRADEPNAVTAIDILLEPDATMIKKAEAANERLLKASPRASPWARRISRTSRACSGT